MPTRPFKVTHVLQYAGNLQMSVSFLERVIDAAGQLEGPEIVLQAFLKVQVVGLDMG